MRVLIDSDEWYPVYFITDSKNYGTEVEVDDATLARWKAVEAAFNAVQDEMANLEAAALRARRADPR